MKRWIYSNNKNIYEDLFGVKFNEFERIYDIVKPRTTPNSIKSITDLINSINE